MTEKTKKSGPGGYRPGSGRKKGTKNAKTLMKEAVLEEVLTRAIQDESTPLEVMLSIMRDPETDAAMRFEAAKAAAPYVHPRLSQVDSTVTHKHDVDELTTAELDKLLAAELAARKAGKAESGGEPDRVH